MIKQTIITLSVLASAALFILPVNANATTHNQPSFVLVDEDNSSNNSGTSNDNSDQNSASSDNSNDNEDQNNASSNNSNDDSNSDDADKGDSSSNSDDGND